MCGSLMDKSLKFALSHKADWHKTVPKDQNTHIVEDSWLEGEKQDNCRELVAYSSDFRDFCYLSRFISMRCTCTCMCKFVMGHSSRRQLPQRPISFPHGDREVVICTYKTVKAWPFSFSLIFRPYLRYSSLSNSSSSSAILRIHGRGAR